MESGDEQCIEDAIWVVWGKNGEHTAGGAGRGRGVSRRQDMRKSPIRESEE